MPNGNRSTDLQIAQVADDNDRAVVTKDRDFGEGHVLRQSPRQLLVLATGNITNDAQLSLVEAHLDPIVAAIEEAAYAELSAETLRVGRRGRQSNG